MHRAFRHARTGFRIRVRLTHMDSLIRGNDGVWVGDVIPLVSGNLLNSRAQFR